MYTVKHNLSRRCDFTFEQCQQTVVCKFVCASEELAVCMI